MTTSHRATFDELTVARDQAAEDGDLRRTLELDNELEDGARHGSWPRRTCWPCRSWADHVHAPRDGARMRVDGGAPVAYQDTLAATQVFALAATAAPDAWSETASAAQVVVDMGQYQYLVTVHTGQPGNEPARTAWISACAHQDTSWPRAFPAIHASARSTAAIIEAYLHAVYENSGPTPARPAGPVRIEDPDELLAQFRARHTAIDATIAGHDGQTSDPAGGGDHHDRLAVLHREASELMAALDAHLTGGGRLPRAWTPAAPA